MSGRSPSWIVQWIAALGSGSTKAQHDPLIVPGKRQIFEGTTVPAQASWPLGKACTLRQRHSEGRSRRAEHGRLYHKEQT
jgi:hypothetical protein